MQMIDYQSNMPIQPKKQKPLGALRLKYVIYFFQTIILFTPAYCYYMAVSRKQQKPFPHATVTDTACHYPQAIIFRWAMTVSAGFLALVLHIVFRFYEKQARKYQYPGNTYSYMYWPTILSVFGYMAAISTIDIGGTGSMHSIGAVYFFICLYFVVVNFTIISVRMRRWDVRFMSKWSLIQKIIVATYLSIIWTYCVIGLILSSMSTQQTQLQGKGDKYVVIVQWNLVYAGLIWILCFVGDVNNVYLVFDNGAVSTKNQDYGTIKQLDYNTPIRY